MVENLTSTNLYPDEFIQRAANNINKNASILGIRPEQYIEMFILIADFYQQPPNTKLEVWQKIFDKKHISPNPEAGRIVAKVNSIIGIANQTLTGDILDCVYKAASLRELTLDGMHKYLRDYLQSSKAKPKLVNGAVENKATNLGQIACMIAVKQRAAWGEIPLFR